jgi:cell division septation protein DedD
VWYRVFTGYFREMAEAEAFSAKKGIAEARVKRTRYTTLIGRFRGAQELRRRSEQVRELGYSPYVIPGADGTSRLHVGSFFTRAGAQKQKADLAAHGIESRIVDR